MKGMVFTTFTDLVEEEFGFEMWDALVEQVKPPTDGVYVATGNYPDSELIALVMALSEKTGTPATTLQLVFGEYLFKALARGYPQLLAHDNAKDFLLSVHDVVHRQVLKLYPDAELPDFRYEDPGDNRLVMIYESKRDLPCLAEGLIQGAAKHYGVAITQTTEPCKVQDGTPCYRMELTIS